MREPVSFLRKPNTRVAIVVGEDTHDRITRALQQRPELLVVDARGLEPELDYASVELHALAELRMHDEHWATPLCWLDGFVEANPQIPIELEPPPLRYRAILAIVAVMRGAR